MRNGEKATGSRSLPCTLRSAAATSAKGGRLAQVGGAHRVALDEAGDEAGRVVEERHDLGPDAGPGGDLVGRPLRPPVDLEHLGVLARQPDHDVVAAEAGAEVAVRDPALQRHRLALRRSQHLGEPLGRFRQGIDGIHGVLSWPLTAGWLAT